MGHKPEKVIKLKMSLGRIDHNAEQVNWLNEPLGRKGHEAEKVIGPKKL